VDEEAKVDLAQSVKKK